MGKFEISKRSNGDYQFVLKADNGQIILSSQGYAFKSSCENGINSVKNNAPDDSHYERKKSSDDKFYFILKAGNGQAIGASQMYEAAAGVEKGIQSVKDNAPGAEIVEI